MPTGSNSQWTGTNQARVKRFEDVLCSTGEQAFSALAELSSQLERELFAQFASGVSPASLKTSYIARHGISGRLFNSIRVGLEGRISAVRASMEGESARLGRAIARAEEVIVRLESKEGSQFSLHHKRRRLYSLRNKLARLQEDRVSGRVRLCFGSRRLWRRQFDLPANGYPSHQDWLAEWPEAKSDEFFLMGSRDETSGCQICVATVQDDVNLWLRVRLPDALVPEFGKYRVIPDVNFNHGHAQVLAAPDSCREFADCRRQKDEKTARQRQLGQALSYRFKQDARGWRVFATTRVQPVEVVTDKRLGAVGVDLNSGHLAVCETDSSGNPVRSWSVPLVTYGKSYAQDGTLVGDAVASVAAHAKEVGKRLLDEKLDFTKMRAALEAESRKQARMLSSFAYDRVNSCFLSREYREGVEVHQVNPACSSVIGRVKFMERYRLSAHQAAALVLALRLLGCSQRIPRLWVSPDGECGHVAFQVVARKDGKHVWSSWGSVRGQLRLALAAWRGPRTRRRVRDPVQGLSETDVPDDFWAVTSSAPPGEITGQSRLEQLGRRRGPVHVWSKD